ncbi:MAG: hypothetical protein PUD51_01885 [Prevotellaceae bacterium]|nr:hypothetical protein [Prevotellaceae bacterium]
MPEGQLMDNGTIVCLPDKRQGDVKWKLTEGKDKAVMTSLLGT